MDDLATDARCTAEVQRARRRVMFQNAKGTDFFMEERNKALKGVLGSSTQRAWEISSKCFDDLCDMRTALSKSVKRLASRWRSEAAHRIRRRGFVKQHVHCDKYRRCTPCAPRVSGGFVKRLPYTCLARLFGAAKLSRLRTVSV
ncbi:hypothetical protein RI054_26g107950 [Pseudoscourfieldia marina]